MGKGRQLLSEPLLRVQRHPGSGSAVARSARAGGCGMSPPALPHRVLMPADTVGGVWTYAVDLCHGLGNLGVEITLLSMGRMPDDVQRAQLARLHNVTFVPSDYRLEWAGAAERDLAPSGELLLALARELKPDVVHVNGYWH